ncbi:MAG: hypothetical protein LKF79_03565 [Solobacterium sp.]|jgi:sodium-dependent dicarboxylate transporter 2/3/5|nr:hypothetical protein [Solobacterium sp.]MCH4222042.1 hypothetical protein [Solobacterium sp.]MCH4265704.1 hypothetical protein [Solobacterium sp.]
MTAVKSDKALRNKIINSVIGVAIMFVFRFLPLNLTGVTEIGMQIIGIFLGTLYLWTFVDVLWPSLLAIVMIGFSDYGTMSEVMKLCFGNITVVQAFYMMCFVGAMVHNKITLYIGRFFITRKISNGRPWLFSFILLLGCFLIAVFVNAFAPIFLFWPVMYSICEDLGFKKTDKYPRIMLILIVMASLLGFPVPPYMNNGLALLSNFRTISANAGATYTISNGTYFITTFVLALFMLIVLVLFTKFVLRPDVTPLKHVDVEQFKKNPLPPMNIRQKIIGISFILFIFVMLVPTLVPDLPGMSFLSSNALGMAFTFVAVLAAIPLKDGKPVLEFPAVMATDFAWPTYFIITAAILLGNVLTNESTGVTVFLNNILSPIFTGMSPLVFTIVLLLIAVVLTNLCNSLVIGMILQPVVLMYCTSAGVDAAPIVTLLIFFVLLSACVTPAASLFAAIMFGNKEWLTSSDVYRYAGTFLVVEIALILCVGIPFVNLMM